MIRKKFSSAFILMGTVLCASSASANMSPEEAWEHIVSRAQASDYVVSAIKSRDGDQLTVTDIVFRIDDFDAGFSLKFETGDWQFSQQADGSVRMDMAEDARWALRFKDMDDERVEIDVAQFSKDSLMVFKRDGDEISSEYEFGSLRLDFVRMADEIEVIGKDQLQFSVTLNDISGNSQFRQSDFNVTSGNMDIATAWIDMNIAPKEEDFRASWRSNFSDIVFSSTSQTRDGVSLQDFEKAIRLGMNSATIYSYGQGQTEIRFVGEDGDVVMSSSTTGGRTNADLSKLGVNFLSEMSGWNVSVGGSLVPMPFDASLGALVYGMSLPVVSSEEQQKVGLRLEMEDLSVSDAVWDMFDPFRVFDRDRVTLKFDVSGMMRLLADFSSFDVEDADDIGAFQEAAELNSLSINSLLLSALGASAAVDGEFTFDNSDFYTFDGVPRPEGSVRLTMKGINALLDKLSNSGLIGSEEVMGARMFMGMFTIPVGRDELEAELWIDQNGGVYANGQQIQ